MRSKTLLLFLLGGSAAIGCAAEADSLFGEQSGTPVGNESAGDGAIDRSSTDAAPPSFASVGSPLCGFVEKRCFPDDGDGNLESRPAAATKCAGADAGAMEKTPGCRLTANDAGEPLPECFTDGSEQSDPKGIDGTSCNSGADCAPGFDCIAGEKGGFCRRYCCSGSCTAHAAQSGGPTFCDVQRLYGTSQRAPVCMPIKECELLTPNECSADETCAIVNEDGDTACVAIGRAKAGEGCDAEHCAENLTCIGRPGNRQCYALCRTDEPSCPDGEKCTTNTLFQPGYGFCKEM